MIEFKDLKINVDDKQIINDFNLKVRPGELHVIMGPNGSGKSTLANAIAGHPKYSIKSGSIKYNTKSINDLSPEIYKILPIDQSFEINNINAPLILSFQINDDYGLEKSFIEYTIIKPDYIESDSSLTTKIIKHYPNQTTYSKEVYNWDISNYNLFPGDQI